MSKIFIILGIAVFGLSLSATAVSIIAGTIQWMGWASPFSAALPPQSLVVGGIFLGVPIMSMGWGLIWFGGWTRRRR